MTADFERIQHIQVHLEAINFDMFENSQTLIYNEMCDLAAWKSFVGRMWAQYKKDCSKAKVDAYNSLIFSQRASGFELSASLAKDYIASKAGELQYFVDYTEKVSSNLLHTLEALRSILSALKQEMLTAHYSGNQAPN